MRAILLFLLLVGCPHRPSVTHVLHEDVLTDIVARCERNDGLCKIIIDDDSRRVTHVYCRNGAHFTCRGSQVVLP